MWAEALRSDPRRHHPNAALGWRPPAIGMLLMLLLLVVVLVLESAAVAMKAHRTLQHSKQCQTALATGFTVTQQREQQQLPPTSSEKDRFESHNLTRERERDSTRDQLLKKR